MLIARQVFQAHYGRGDDLIALLQEFNTRFQESAGHGAAMRILTDVTGPFFTVVTELEIESLAAWEEQFGATMDRPWIGEWFGRMMPLVESGSREFYRVIE